jgi:hypothetical protein
MQLLIAYSCPAFLPALKKGIILPIAIGTGLQFKGDGSWQHFRTISIKNHQISYFWLSNLIK